MGDKKKEMPRADVGREAIKFRDKTRLEEATVIIHNAVVDAMMHGKTAVKIESCFRHIIARASLASIYCDEIDDLGDMWGLAAASVVEHARNLGWTIELRRSDNIIRWSAS
jgi:hypothetical protein